eukprot:1721665-Prymnesium_polylepis.1
MVQRRATADVHVKCRAAAGSQTRRTLAERTRADISRVHELTRAGTSGRERTRVDASGHKRTRVDASRHERAWRADAGQVGGLGSDRWRLSWTPSQTRSPVANAQYLNCALCGARGTWVVLTNTG